MRRLTGFILFSFLCLVPLGVEGKVRDPVCPTGSHQCPCSKCAADGVDCSTVCPPPKIIPLEKKENTIYSISEGGVIKCEDNKKLTPIPGTTTYTCGPEEEGAP